MRGSARGRRPGTAPRSATHAGAEPGTRSRVLAALACALLLGCGAEPASRRVLVVGVDGATLRVIEPMMREGRLPHLAAIASDGVYGVLRSQPPLRSPRIWTTIATGKLPRRHRIRDFTVRKPDGKRRLVASSDRRGHALWNIASDRGLTVASVNWWVTHPPEKIRGVMVSDHFLPSVVQGRSRFFRAAEGPALPTVYPEAWAPRIAEEVPRDEAQAAGPQAFADEPLPEWANREYIERWYRDDERVGRIALDITRELEPDLMLVLFKGVDPASHVFFATLFDDGELPLQLAATGDERAAGRRVLERFYEHTDVLLGRLLAHYTRDDLVLVVSDHGFEVRDRFTRLTGQHLGGEATEGILFARGAGIAAGGEAGEVHIHDVTPTVLQWLGLPLARNMDGRPAAFVGGEAPPPIETYDLHPIERMVAEGPGVEDEIMEQLEVLGYFEAEDAGEPAPAASPETHP